MAIPFCTSNVESISQFCCGCPSEQSKQCLNGKRHTIILLKSWQIVTEMIARLLPFHTQSHNIIMNGRKITIWTCAIESAGETCEPKIECKPFENILRRRDLSDGWCGFPAASNHWVYESYAVVLVNLCDQKSPEIRSVRFIAVMKWICSMREYEWVLWWRTSVIWLIITKHTQSPVCCGWLKYQRSELIWIFMFEYPEMWRAVWREATEARTLEQIL